MKIHFLKKQLNSYYNIEKWNISECPLLIITGLSGSGKTTYAKKIANKYNAILISFDVLKFYKESSNESKKILKCFLKEYPSIKKLVQIKWKKTDKIFSNDILYNYFCNVFFDFLLKYSKDNCKLMIIEGIQIFVRLHPHKTTGLPLIIIGNSCLDSHIYKMKRDYISNYRKSTFSKYMKELYMYHIKQWYDLNRYILYYEVLNLFST